MYAPETEKAEGVGNMTLILTFGETLRTRRLKDGYFGIKLSERFLAGALRCEYSSRVRGERVLTPTPTPPKKKEECLGYQRKGNRQFTTISSPRLPSILESNS